MKKQFGFLLIACCFACTTKITLEDLHHLNGYWEIASVSFADGTTKTYTMNPTIDYIEWDGIRGFRKKMYPSLDGKFTTSNDAEPLKIIQDEDRFLIQYESNFGGWHEKLVYLGKESFKVINEEGITYTYKRHEPITLDK